MRWACLLPLLLAAGCASGKKYDYATELPKGDNPMDALVRDEPYRAHLIQERARTVMAPLLTGLPMEEALQRLKAMGAECREGPDKGAHCEYENSVSDLRYAKGELLEERVTWFDWTFTLSQHDGQATRLAITVTSTRPPLGSPVSR
jgi:hypothetical protein